MRLLIGVFSVLLFFACKTSETTKKEPIQPKPFWVESRPLNAFDYVGIGVAQKRPGENFIESAKSNALSDLASEIKVNLESNTVYNQVERNGIVNEDFRSTITTSAAADIEGYEMVGSWQNEEEYWVYYKLSKADYLKRVEDKRQTAKSSSLDYIDRAKEFQEKGEVKVAIQKYFDAFTAIQAYPASSIEVVYNGSLTFLDNLIYINLQQLFSQISFKTLGEASELSFANRFETHLPVEVSYAGKKLQGLPFMHSYLTQYGSVTQTVFSNEMGILDVHAKVKALQPKKVTQSLTLDLNELIGSREDAAFLKYKVAKLIPPRHSLELSVIAPKVYVSSNEKSLGNSSNREVLRSLVVSELAKEGVLIVDQVNKADLILSLISDTQFQSQSNDFTAVGLTYSLVITERSNNKTVLSLEEGPVKGVSLDKERASVKAYEKAEGQLKRVGMTKIKSSILDF